MVGWQWLFIINLPIAAIVLAMSLKLLTVTRPERKSSFDWRGMTALGVLLSAFAFGLNQINTADFLMSLSSLSVWPFLTIALVLLPTFVFIERRAEDPILHLILFRNRQVVLSAALSVGAGLSEAAVVFVPALLVSAFSVTSSTASFMLIPVVLAMAIGSPLAGRLLDRTGSKVVVLLGTTLLATGMLMVTFIATTHLVLFYFVAILIGLGLSILLGGSLRYIMLNETSSVGRTAGQGVLSLSISIGQLVGGTLVGAVVASRGGSVGGYETAFLIIGLIMFLLAISTLGLKGRTEELRTAQLSDLAYHPD